MVFVCCDRGFELFEAFLVIVKTALLFEYAREHADASGLLNHQNPLLPALLSIDLEQEGRLEDHEQRLEELEAAVAASDDQEAVLPDSNP